MPDIKNLEKENPKFISEENKEARVPPQNIEAEKSVLGALMLDKDAITQVADTLKPDDFYKGSHEKIYETMLDLYDEREPIDLLTLSGKLEEKGDLEKVGGRSYLAELVNSVPTSSNVTYYANIVQKKSTLRKLINAASKIIEMGYKSERKNISKILDKAESTLFNVSQNFLKEKFIPIKNVLTEAFDRIDQLHRGEGKLRGLSTGFADLDNMLAGFQKGNLIVLAARPSVGKSALACDFIRHIAVREKVPVGIFSLEMSREELVDRFLCAEAGVDLWKMRTGHLGDRKESDDFPKIGYAMGALSEAPIFIDDSASCNVMEIRTKARRLQAEHKIGFLVVDYLQLMEGTSRENRVQEVSEISRALKGVAKELSIPILAISQLSRAVESRQPPIPKLADLRESGSIEQDADVVLFIYREELYKPDADRKNIADILIAKHRNGPTGKTSLFFNKHQVSFKSLETKIKEGQDAVPEEVAV
ncbi:replicative DNA helicase [bacterium (Candidatus Torokbacteria) CG_4_10_14_0_2_um_filter_35_8]|nr:MAG: replicative DNA helicase [bacterium (Candidatus Torokbacteria) CG_4_10_14_0_2_um_filter_35_8]